MSDVYEAAWAALKATGIDFAQEAWNAAPPGDYGVLAITGEPVNFYADDEIILTQQSADVHLYTRDAGHAAAQAVMDALDTVDGLSYTNTARELLPDVGLMHYRWILSMEV